MCEADKAEVMAFAGHTPLEALKHSVAQSFTSTIFYFDGKPIGIFGLATSDYEGTQGSPWLLSTGKTDGFKKQFLEISKEVIEDFSKPFERLIVTAHSKNLRSLKWLYRLGFVKLNNININNELFYTMELRNAP